MSLSKRYRTNNTTRVKQELSGDSRPMLLSEDDIYMFNEGTHYRLYEKLGARRATVNGEDGTYFAVWAPNAQSVAVMGDFNRWNSTSHRMSERGRSGIWECFVSGVISTVYKYHIVSHYNEYKMDKADPFAFYCEVPPKTGSIVWDIGYQWQDNQWMASRKNRNRIDTPMSIYEVHLGSWKRIPAEKNRSLTYRELAPLLAGYVKSMGFTHVELMPLMEHPFYGSWGYQTTGYFAPTSRYGTPQDFMYMIDYLHQNEIGVILDWVPSHFPSDNHSLAFFDGTHLYEHSDPRKGFHPEWKSYIFNYGRNEVVSFLISSANFWLDKYHADGIRVDAVASMLYLDYARKEGEWIPNEHGGRENLEAVAFLRKLNEEIYRSFPDVQTIAEESTAWPMVSRPTYLGGLGFGMKWDMGWMHDTLEYMSKDAVHRKYHHSNITFRMLYAFAENFVLPLSHDEVVYGKGSLLGKMPGDDWQKFANLRLLLGYMYTQPGKKLLFMGSELAQWKEWNHEDSPDWHFLQYQPHAQIQAWARDINELYKNEASLFEQDCFAAGFEWIDANNIEQSIYVFLRRGKSTDSVLVVICNFTPMVYQNYRIGVPSGGMWEELLNSDHEKYGGSGHINKTRKRASKISANSRPYSIKITVPPLAIACFKNATRK